ncbi:hypothetical protein PROFUN_06162 [Planoprotostelium fungivorum]|uniref:Uncharacterized protein n=1 Tax=Planoprotostelium fungivorum TaxID=1890364 RepID=A0A2P6NPR1_9EUKA|nr:hypothetical protein PROFUN_06162 [Planoprotostelium fungivorum]
MPQADRRSATLRPQREELTLGEFRARVLSSVNKLNKRDTLQKGTNELLFILDQLNPNEESLPIFMDCLLSSNEGETSFYRKDVTKLVSTAAGVFQHHLHPFLPKILQNFTKYLKDKDVAVHQECATAFGVIATNLSTEERYEPLDTYLKPLLTHFTEQSRPQQQGAALCIAAVLANSPQSQIAESCHDLITRFQKLLVSNSTLCKGGVYHILTTISQKCIEQSIKCIPSILSSVSDGFACTEWTDRKAAAEAVRLLAQIFRTALSPYKSSLIDLLEKARFDKMKPARDAINSALVVVQSLPSSNEGQVEADIPLGRTSRPASRAGSVSSRRSTQSNPIHPDFSATRSTTSQRKDTFNGTSFFDAPTLPEKERRMIEVPDLEEEDLLEDDVSSVSTRKSVNQPFFVPVGNDVQSNKENFRTENRRLVDQEVLYKPREDHQGMSQTISQLREEMSQMNLRYEQLANSFAKHVEESNENVRFLRQRLEQLESRQAIQNMTTQHVMSVTRTGRPSIDTLASSPKVAPGSPKRDPFVREMIRSPNVSDRPVTEYINPDPESDPEIQEQQLREMQEDVTWNTALDNVNIGNVDGAYRTVLEDGDTLLLLRLMDYTGTVIDNLDISTATELFLRFVSFVKGNRFLDNVFPWLQYSLERSIVPLSARQLNDLRKYLQELTAQPNSTGIQASEMLALLRRHIAKLPNSVDFCDNRGVSFQLSSSSDTNTFHDADNVRFDPFQRQRKKKMVQEKAMTFKWGGLANQMTTIPEPVLFVNIKKFIDSILPHPQDGPSTLRFPHDREETNLTFFVLFKCISKPTLFHYQPTTQQFSNAGSISNDEWEESGLGEQGFGLWFCDLLHVDPEQKRKRYRYSLLDAGHVLCTVNIKAMNFGWRVTPLEIENSRLNSLIERRSDEKNGGKFIDPLFIVAVNAQRTDFQLGERIYQMLEKVEMVWPSIVSREGPQIPPIQRETMTEKKFASLIPLAPQGDALRWPAVKEIRDHVVTEPFTSQYLVSNEQLIGVMEQLFHQISPLWLHQIVTGRLVYVLRATEKSQLAPGLYIVLPRSVDEDELRRITSSVLGIPRDGGQPFRHISLPCAESNVFLYFLPSFGSDPFPDIVNMAPPILLVCVCNLKDIVEERGGVGYRQIHYEAGYAAQMAHYQATSQKMRLRYVTDYPHLWFGPVLHPDARAVHVIELSGPEYQSALSHHSYRWLSDLSVSVRLASVPFFSSDRIGGPPRVWRNFPKPKDASKDIMNVIQHFLEQKHVSYPSILSFFFTMYGYVYMKVTGRLCPPSADLITTTFFRLLASDVLDSMDHPPPYLATYILYTVQSGLKNEHASVRKMLGYQLSLAFYLRSGCPPFSLDDSMMFSEDIDITHNMRQNHDVAVKMHEGICRDSLRLFLSPMHAGEDVDEMVRGILYGGEDPMAYVRDIPDTFSRRRLLPTEVEDVSWLRVDYNRQHEHGEPFGVWEIGVDRLVVDRVWGNLRRALGQCECITNLWCSTSRIYNSPPRYYNVYTLFICFNHFHREVQTNLVSSGIEKALKKGRLWKSEYIKRMRVRPQTQSAIGEWLFYYPIE